MADYNREDHGEGCACSRCFLSSCSDERPASEYFVRVRGFSPCRLVSRKVHRGEVQVQFENGARRWFLASKVKGAEKLS